MTYIAADLDFILIKTFINLENEKRIFDLCLNFFYLLFNWILNMQN